MENAENGVVVNTLVVKGCEAVPVEVRATVRPDGVPGVKIDGVFDAVQAEMRTSVRRALRASGFEVPRGSIRIELTPDVRGRAVSGLELPIAAAILAVSGKIPADAFDGHILVGDLSPEGKVLPSEGVRLFQTQLPEGAGLVASRGCDGDVLPAGRHASEVLGIGELGELRRGVSSLSRFAGPSRPLVTSPGKRTAGSKPSATIPRTSWPAPSPTSPPPATSISTIRARRTT